MSVIRMSQLALEPNPVYATGLSAATRSAESGGGDRSNALEKIVTFIPSEAIGLYIAGSGIMQPSSSVERWGLFLFATASIPLVYLLRYFETRGTSAAPGEWNTRRGCWLLSFALLAFVVWGAAMPQSPFLEFHPKMNQYAAVAALALAAFMSKIAELLGLTPKS